MTLTHSEQIGDLAQALLDAQKHFKPAKRSKLCDDGTRIADVPDIYEATRKPLAKQGLVVSQFVGHDAVETLIMHAPTGQWLAARTSSARSLDGQVSYGPRAALLYALGVEEEEVTRPTSIGGERYVGVPVAVYNAMQANKLSSAQMLVIAKSGKTHDEMIAEAERLGGKR